MSQTYLLILYRHKHIYCPIIGYNLYGYFVEYVFFSLLLFAALSLPPVCCYVFNPQVIRQIIITRDYYQTKKLFH